MKYAFYYLSRAIVLLAGLTLYFQVQAAMNGPFEREDHHLSISLRNYYQYRQLKDYTPQYDEMPQRVVKTHDRQKAWGQGMAINFESATWGSESMGVGFDFSLYGGLKLNGENDRYGTTILKEDAPHYDAEHQRYLAKQESYGKLGLANINAYLADERWDMRLVGGWIPIEKPLLQTYHRLTPTSFQGVLAEAQISNVHLYGAWADKVSLYNWDKMENFTSQQPGKGGRYGKHEVINSIYTVGGGYKSDLGLGGHLAYAASESYLQLYFARIDYTFDLSETSTLLLDGHFYQGRENGDKWWGGAVTYGGFDKDAHLYNVNTKLTMDGLAILASFTQVKAEKKGGLGFFDGHLAYDAGNDFDDFDYWTKRQLSGFDHNGEKVWQLGVRYSFDKDQVPGLSLGYTYTEGRDIEASDNRIFPDKYEESEHNIELKYAFQQPELDGLQLTILYAWNKMDKEISQLKNDNKWLYKGMSDTRVFLDYVLKVF
ncbi:OprD family porin [Endozoicomonas sp. Mp262]|uniref:OprD family porin n=1 Tax=Endozoicomonas sp. Mp262 TaxID=2919499 RepID=UPI0021D837AA